jgi:hypothetical protein
MKAYKPFDLSDKINEIQLEISRLQMYASCVKSFDDIDDYLSYVNSDDFQSSSNTINSMKLKLIKLISEL